MSLQVWLPLNGDLHNQGINKDIEISSIGALTFVNNGKIGKCYQRAINSTQTTTGININSNLLNLLGTKASVAMWVKPLGTHTHYNGTLLSSGNWNGKKWAFGVNQDNTKVDVLCGGYNIYINCEVPVNEWTHLCSTFDNGVSKLYKNGIYIGQLTGRAAFDSDATNTCIGRETYAGGYFGFNGLINDVRIYNNVLSEKQVKEIAKGLILHYPLNDKYTESTVNLCNGLVKGGRTVVVGDTITNTGENADTYWWIKPKEALVGGATYTFSCQLQGFSSNSDYISWGVCAQSGANSAGSWKTYNGYNEFTFVMPAGLDGSTANIIFDDNGGVRTQIFTISNIQLEKKDHATPYVGIGGIRNTLSIYDISGYQNNSIKYNITYGSDTPKYEVSSIFKSADTSYIKVNENNWMSQGTEEMTINLWVNPDTSFSKIFSCTESGGWNTESGSSGYLRFPVHVYTNQAKTSTAYKYDSKQLKISDIPLNEWTMITFVYDGTGTRTYINGQLHHTCLFTSYGIHYNTSARLFLGCEANTASPASPYFNGKMSDFRIYATALSAEDILSLYNNEAEVDQSGIIHGQIR